MDVSIDLLCRVASQEEATDLFLRAGDIPSLRVKGTIMELGEDKLPAAEIENFWKSCGVDPAEVMDRDVSYTAADGTRYRANLHRHLGRLGAVLRPVKSVIPEMDALGLPVEVLENWFSRGTGLILVAGVTGTGKSTTVASALQWMSRAFARHIVTLEDPIEYLFRDDISIFTQREVGSDTESFERGLRSSLRQSPDVVFLHEILEASPARVALQAAETGHLVVATLHSGNVPETIERMVSLFPPEERDSVYYILAQRLVGIICQKLLPGDDGNLVLVTEYMQNEGATVNWIRDADLNRLEDFVAKGGASNCQGFLTSIVDAVRDGRLQESIGQEHCENPMEYQRALRGITSGSVSRGD